jgi:hypothetical protein
VALGPSITWVKSMTRTPDSGCVAEVSMILYPTQRRW